MNLYDELKIDRSSTQEDVRKAVRRESLIYHPDKTGTGDRTKYERIQKASEILGDPDRRRFYERHGLNEETVDKAIQQWKEMETTAPQQLQQTKIYPQDISLLEAYTGCEKFVEIQKCLPCSTCYGWGTKSKKQPLPCRQCLGKSYVILRLQKVICSHCGGSGVSDAQETCTDCKGTQRQVNPTLEKLTCTLPPGVVSGYACKFEHKGEQLPNMIKAKHILVYFNVATTHDKFSRRKECDLITEQSVLLGDVLCGGPNVIYDFNHIDGKTYKYHIKTLIEPGSIKKIEGMGMPTTDGKFGDLYIKFKIEFPQYLTFEKRNALKTILPTYNYSNSKEEDDLKIVDLQDTDVVDLTTPPPQLLQKRQQHFRNHWCF